MKRSRWGILGLCCWLVTSGVQAQTTGAPTPAPATARPAAVPAGTAAPAPAAAPEQTVLPEPATTVPLPGQ
jgi:hypothetical protein